MTDVSLCFEVHQPLRLRKDFFWDGSPMRRVEPDQIFDFYFDDPENRRIFERVSEKCYLPANQIILEKISRYQDSERPFKTAYSFSGVFLDQCERYNPEVLESFARLVDTGMVEVLEQTYHHSLASLYEDGREFSEQVKMHRERIWDSFGVRPRIFENTELLYDDRIARIVEGMGYDGIFAEGVVAPPNHVYRPQGCERISLLLRDYQITDDMGFRFSARWWNEYPLTAEKYASWIAAKPGDCVNIFCDYETFGEHQWTDTGIFEFLKFLPSEILKWEHLRFATPSEVVENNPPIGTVNVPVTTSWADIERDTSCWLGNTLQWACYTYHKRLEGPIKEGVDRRLLEIWRTLGLSDHLYYAFTHGGAPGEVHNYFSPYGSPYDAAVTLFSVLSDLQFRVKSWVDAADDPFLFSTGIGQFTGDAAWGRRSLMEALEKANIDSLEYHARRGDLSDWARGSLGDVDLAKRLEGVKGLRGEGLRAALLEAVGMAASTAESGTDTGRGQKKIEPKSGRKKI
ncbi:MAG: alpha-amylase [Methanothrix sp.]|jgi:alpha-amylase|nr:glycoside hydrolase family 57 protein [Methanothrix harundinacea]MDD5768614.1 alpha-amylase [Methanothrix sp.]